MSLDLLQAWLPSALAAACAAIAWFYLRGSSALGLAVGAVGVVAALLLAPPVRGYLSESGTDMGVPANTIRYRLDVALRVDGELVSGSVVQEIALRNRGGNGLPNITGVDARLKGQALLFTFTNQPALVILPMIDGEQDRYQSAILHACGGPEPNVTLSTDEYIRGIVRYRGECGGDWASLPQALTVADLTDANSIRRADLRTLAPALGADAELVSIRVTTTDEPLSTGLETALALLASNPDFRHLGHGFHRDSFISRQ